VKIVTLIEDHPSGNSLIKNEHGLSIFFKADGINYLFDTGLTGLFLQNFRPLNVDEKEINKIIISHGHDDHAGGLMKLLKSIPQKPEIFVGEGFFNRKYKLLENKELESKSCGFSPSDLNGYVLKTVTQPVFQLSKSVYLFAHFKKTNDFEIIPAKYLVERENKLQLDSFREEVAIGIETKTGLVVIVGCSHIGVVNILESIKKNSNFKIRGVIGGTHLINCSKERLKKTSDYLKGLNLEFLAVSHCTGDENIEFLKKEFGDRFILNNSGNTILI